MSDKYPDLYRHELHYPNGVVETFRARKRAWLDLRHGSVKIHVDNKVGFMCFQSLDECNRWLFLEPFSSQGICWVTVENIQMHPYWMINKDNDYVIDHTEYSNNPLWPLNRHPVQIVPNTEEPQIYGRLHGNPYDGAITRNIPEQRANVRFTDTYSFFWSKDWMFGADSGYRAYVPRQLFDYQADPSSNLYDPQLLSDVTWDGHLFIGLSADWSLPGGAPEFDDCNPFFTDYPAS